MNAYRGCEGVAPLINLGSGGMWITSRPGRFTARRESRCLLKRILDGPQSRSGWFWRTENLLPQPRFDHRTFQSLANRCSDYSVRPFKFGKNKSVRSDRPARDMKYVDLWRYLAVYETRARKISAYIIWRHMDTICVAGD